MNPSLIVNILFIRKFENHRFIISESPFFIIDPQCFLSFYIKEHSSADQVFGFCAEIFVSIHSKSLPLGIESRIHNLISNQYSIYLYAISSNAASKLLKSLTVYRRAILKVKSSSLTFILLCTNILSSNFVKGHKILIEIRQDMFHVFINLNFLYLLNNLF